jgi:hypothetical protein
MEGILMCPQKPCKSEGHKRCLNVRTLHQPISKATKACDKMTLNGFPCDDFKKLFWTFSRNIEWFTSSLLL